MLPYAVALLFMPHYLFYYSQPLRAVNREMRKGGDNLLNPVNSSHVHQLFPPFVVNRRLDSGIKGRYKYLEKSVSLARLISSIPRKIRDYKIKIKIGILCTPLHTSTHNCMSQNVCMQLNICCHQEILNPTKFK